MQRDEPKPPWAVSKSIFPGDDPYWRTPEGRTWLRDVFLPFYDALPHAGQIAYRRRWNAPNPWVTLFLHPEIDADAADADEEETGQRVEPLNFRELWLGDAAAKS